MNSALAFIPTEDLITELLDRSSIAITATSATTDAGFEQFIWARRGSAYELLRLTHTFQHALLTARMSAAVSQGTDPMPEPSTASQPASAALQRHRPGQ